MFLRKLLLSLLIIPINSFAKEKPPAFISKILSYKKPVYVFDYQLAVNTMPILKIKDLTGTFNFTGQSINKNERGLFMNHLGTGRLYQWKGDASIGEWVRIDSTYFTGYNFLSLFFSIDSTLYSFGGTGFWYHNGNLRKYNFTSHEWSAKLLNTSIPWLRDVRNVMYIDSAGQALYFNGQGRFHDASINKNIDSSTFSKIYKLDINDGTVTEMGNYDESKGDFFGQTPWGVIISFNELMDLVNNKYYKLSENVENNLLRVLTKSNNNRFAWQYSFWIDSTLYFAAPNQGYDSVIIHKSDLIETNKPVYRKEIAVVKNNNKNTSNNTWIALIAILSIGNVLFFVKYRKEKNKYLSSNGIDYSQQEFIINEKSKLNEIEKNLLQLIFENSILKKPTSITEINTVLGCTNKNIEIQKRLRSDAINAINQKLYFIFLTDQKIIERKRTAIDARSFEYYIDEKHLPQINKLFA
ncbi:MAG: hypothetical protein EBU73_00365 [Chitinophagia bacterium]|jgi:hypothetical protein|nr:hypothetical protein [Chitinophagia bacterium]